MEISIIILIVSLLSIKGYLIYRLYVTIKQVEDLEDYAIELEETIIQLNSRIEESYNRLRSVDRRGSFEADDEVGYIFKDIKSIIQDLNKVITKQ